MGEPYRRKRTFYQDISGSTQIGALTTTTTLVSARNANQSLYIQKLHIEVTAGSGGVTWSFEDTAASPVLLVPSVSAASVAHFDFDFGPEGIPCTQGTNFQVVISAAGAAGWIAWEGYQKQTGIEVGQYVSPPSIITTNPQL